MDLETTVVFSLLSYCYQLRNLFELFTSLFELLSTTIRQFFKQNSGVPFLALLLKQKSLLLKQISLGKVTELENELANIVGELYELQGTRVSFLLTPKNVQTRVQT